MKQIIRLKNMVEKEEGEGNKKDDEEIPINYSDEEDNTQKKDEMFEEIIVALFTFAAFFLFSV